MADEILREPPRRLPVLDVAGRSYGYVWDQRTLLLGPLSVVFLIQYVVAIAGQLGGDAKPDLSRTISLLAISVAGIVGLMTFAVGLHRTILTGDIRHGIFFLRWDHDLRRYAWAWFKIFVLALAGAVIVAFLGGIVAALMHAWAHWKNVAIGLGALLGVGIVIVPRSVLALPAAALGEDGSIRRSWHITRGNGLRMIGVLLLATLPFILLGLLLKLPAWAAGVMSKAVPNVAEALISLKYVLMAFSAALQAVSTAVLTATLSFSYGALATPPDSPE